MVLQVKAEAANGSCLCSLRRRWESEQAGEPVAGYAWA